MKITNSDRHHSRFVSPLSGIIYAFLMSGSALIYSINPSALKDGLEKTVAVLNLEEVSHISNYFAPSYKKGLRLIGLSNREECYNFNESGVEVLASEECPTASIRVSPE